jgi:WD40 repeat protein
VTWSIDGTARVWDPQHGTTRAVLVAQGDAVTGASFGEHGLVLTTAADGRARLWRVPIEAQLQQFASVAAPARAAAFTPDGQVAVVAAASGLFAFDHDGRLLSRLPMFARTVAVDDNGRNAAAAAGHRIVVYRLSDGHVEATFREAGKPTSIAFSPDGRELADGTSSGTIRVRRLQGGVTTLARTGAAVTSISFNPSGTRIAAGLGNGDLAVWIASDGALVFRRPAHRAGTPVLGVAFDRSGAEIVTAGRDTEVHIWGATDGRPIADLRGHFALVSGAAFSPDGRWIVSAGPGTAGLWDVANRQRFLFLEGHRGRLLAAVFDASGRRIETVGADGTLRAYDCEVCGGVGELLRLADRRLAGTARRLTSAEARLYGVTP